MRRRVLSPRFATLVNLSNQLLLVDAYRTWRRGGPRHNGTIYQPENDDRTTTFLPIRGLPRLVGVGVRPVGPSWSRTRRTPCESPRKLCGCVPSPRATFWAICSGIDADDTQKIHFLKVETHRSDLPSTSSYHAVEMSARRLRAVPWAATSRWRPSQKCRSRNSTVRA